MDTYLSNVKITQQWTEVVAAGVKGLHWIFWTEALATLAIMLHLSNDVRLHGHLGNRQKTWAKIAKECLVFSESGRATWCYTACIITQVIHALWFPGCAIELELNFFQNIVLVPSLSCALYWQLSIIAVLSDRKNGMGINPKRLPWIEKKYQPSYSNNSSFFIYIILNISDFGKIHSSQGILHLNSNNKDYTPYKPISVP